MMPTSAPGKAARRQRSTRRGFLQGLVAIVALAWQPGRAAPSDSPAAAAERARDSLRGLRLGNAAPALGRAYLEKVPQEASLTALLKAIESDFSPGPRPLGEINEPLLRQRAAKDFEAGRIVELNGWVVSLAEARLCAVAALV
jgi:hypothetical protein